jgi:hypothetical protein
VLGDTAGFAQGRLWGSTAGRAAWGGWLAAVATAAARFTEGSLAVVCGGEVSGGRAGGGGAGAVYTKRLIVSRDLRDWLIGWLRSDSRRHVDPFAVVFDWL